MHLSRIARSTSIIDPEKNTIKLQHRIEGNYEMRFASMFVALMMSAAALIHSQQLVMAQTAAATKPDSWQAGLAKICITPKKPMPMGGYVSRTQWAPMTIHDLGAKALVLQDAKGQRAVLITLDLVGIARDISVPICEIIQQTYGIPRAAIAICASHTHTGPVVGTNLPSAGGAAYSAEAQALIDEYAKSLVEQIPKLVGEAIKDLKPASLHWGTGSATFAVNRRNNPEPKVPELRAANALKGPVDHDLPVLVVTGKDGRMRGIVGGYACHATVLTDVGWSGDWPGFGQAELEKRHPEAMAFFWAGCGADQNPLPRRTIPLAKEYGAKFADAVDQVLAGKLQPITAELNMSYEEIDIPFAKTPTREQFEKDAQGKGPSALRAKHLFKQWQEQGQIAASYPNYPVQCWKLGNSVEWIFLGGEVVVDYALRLKQAQPAGATWVAGYSNDVMAYIPSRRVLAEGGYEGSTSMVYYGLPGDWHESIEQSIVKAVESMRPATPAKIMRYREADGTEKNVTNAADWPSRRARILAGMSAVMGELPDRAKLKPPTAEVLESVNEPTFVRQSLRIAIDDHDQVPAYFYVPKSRAKGVRLPAVLALHQTSALGKKEVDGQGKADQQYARELALQGFVVLAPDYPSFGDYRCDFSDARYASGSIKGIYNHMRCIDWLSAREEVDPHRIGVIGHSLGGHNALFLAAFDERVKATVTSCGWTPFHDYHKGDLTGWTSARYMPRIKNVYELKPERVPFDFDEVLAAIAPRALLSISPVNDSNFAVAGVRKAIPEVQAVYRLLGAENKLQVRHPECQHSFPLAERKAAYEFLATNLNAASSGGGKSIAEELTRVAPLEPAEAVKSFSVVPGFRVEQVAAEPLIHSPIAAAFDENGRLFVVEMPDYSEQDKEMLGKVRLLEDTDADGHFDKSTIYVDRLSWPTAVIAYNGGVFIGAAPDILYAKDTDSDGRADEQRVVFTGFGRTNVQALLNSFQWGLDGRIHGATSNNGATVRRPDDPQTPSLVLGRRDFSFDPRKFDIRAESGGGQYGMSFDDWGHKFNCDNSTPLATSRYEDRYAARNPDFAPPGARQVSTNPVEIFRTSPVEPWRVVRTRLRVAGKAPGPIEHGGKAAGYFSGATGITAYRGNAFPAEMRDQIFVADPCSNIIHRKKIRVEGTDLVGQRIDEGKEFVASCDNWCRPVQFANAPDGTLYFMDMYREVIEHPWSIPAEVKQHIDLTSGQDRGRIYRIVPADFQQPSLPRLGSANTEELVRTLEHRNGWHRDTAARMLIERQSLAAVPALQQLVEKSPLPEARLHALYVLASLGQLQTATIFTGLADNDSRVRKHAVRLAEQFSGDRDVLEKLCTLAKDPDPRVCCQLAFSLGEFTGEIRNSALAEIAIRHAEKPLIRTAVLTSLAQGAGYVLEIVSRDMEFGRSPTGRAFFYSLAQLIGVQLRADEVRRYEQVLAEVAPQDEAAAFELLQGYAEGRTKARAERQRELPHSAQYRTLLGQLLERSQARPFDNQLPLNARVQAIRFLGLGTYEDFQKVGVLLIDHRQPQELQLAAIETLAKFRDPAIGRLLTQAWPQLSPRVRVAAVELLFSRTVWLLTLLDAIEQDQIAVSELGPARLQLLANRKEPEIVERYRKLARRNAIGTREDVIKAYQSTLSLKGDPAQGKVHFQKICAACHRLENMGHELGPNLAAFKSRGAEDYLVNVLDPNREVNPQYLNYLATLTNGRTLSGIIADESAASITLKRAENASDTIQRNELEDLRSTRQSIMPEGMEKQLDHQALADLISYLLNAP